MRGSGGGSRVAPHSRILMAGLVFFAGLFGAAVIEAVWTSLPVLAHGAYVAAGWCAFFLVVTWERDGT